MVLKNKIAVITGGSKGIGKAIAESLARERAKLAICSRNEIAIMSAAKELNLIDDSVRVLFKRVDVKYEDEVRSFVNDVISEFGQIDYLINNAGTGDGGLLENISIEDYNNIIDTNLKGSYLMMKYVIPFMKVKKAGHIVNISSIAGDCGIPGASIYSASKAALSGLSLSLREELREHNIRLSVIKPGAVNTDIWGEFGNNFDKNKMIRPEDVGKTVLFILENSATCNFDEITIMPHSGILSE
jgi:3-oxoacyl-[acyl-carrier protein] reductase